MRISVVLVLALLAVSSTGKTFRAKGSSRNGIVDEVKEFKEKLGPVDINEPTALASGFGRREINWDDVPNSFEEPNLFPPNFYNLNNSAAQGIEFYPVGYNGKLLVSDKDFDQSDIAPYSKPAVFALEDANEMFVMFYHPATREQSFVRGFGAVFLDVDKKDTYIEYYDIEGERLEKVTAPTENEGYSFAGYISDDHDIFYVRVKLGTTPLDSDGEFPDDDDAVAMDDVIWSNVKNDPDYEIFAASGNDVAELVVQFKASLGEQNPNEPQCYSSGFRSVDWDALPDSQSFPNQFDPKFFDATFSPRARGITFNSDGPALFVSASPESGEVLDFGSSELTPFSAPRMFAPDDSTKTVITWDLPCVRYTDATVRAVGVVYINVRGADVAWMELFDNERPNGDPEERLPVIPYSGGSPPFSFSAIKFKKAVVDQAHLISGRVDFEKDGGFQSPHPVVIDDVIFSEPEGNPQQAPFGTTEDLQTITPQSSFSSFTSFDE